MRLFLFVMCLMFIQIVSAETISWTHDSVTDRFEIWGNTQASTEIERIASIEPNIRSFEVELPIDCSAINIIIVACDDSGCGKASNIKSYKKSCPLPSSPVLGFN